ncbi:Endothelin-converting enzyme [Nymphon striatum]|nr:Endothelin-converting enzyme [Nymphon striatum]
MSNHSISSIYCAFRGMTPKYKRSEWEEEDGSSNCSYPSEAPMYSGNAGPPGMNPTVRVHNGKPRTFWQRLSSFEKLLLFIISLLTLLVFILSIVINVYRNSALPTPTVTVVMKHDNVSKSRNKEKILLEDQICQKKSCVISASTLLSAMDDSVDPCSDFYSYACGGWIKSNPIPDNQPSWGMFHKLAENNQITIRSTLEKPINESDCEAIKKAKIYYTSCMDVNETIESLGAKPLQDFLSKIGGWSISGNFSLDSWSFQNLIQTIQIEYAFSGGLFNWEVGKDDKNSSHYIIQIDQGGLSLPSEHYYLNKSDDDPILNAYLEYMTTVGVLLGGDKNSTREKMKEVLNFETKIAKFTIPDEKRRDEEKLYNNMTISKLQKLAPFFRWKQYFNTAAKTAKTKFKLFPTDSVVVFSPNFLRNLTNLVKEYQSTDENKFILNDYMVWQAVRPLSQYISKNFRDARNILRKALLGLDGQQTKWRMCASDTTGAVGFAVGAMFVQNTFNGESKPIAEKMIESVRAAFKQNLDTLQWMDSETRRLAKEKADAITDMIGYPDFILNPDKLDKKYEGLEFEINEYFENNLRLTKFALSKNMEKLKKKVDHKEWDMVPSDVNAYYEPSDNKIVFPAGILQKPFFSLVFPRALQFGGIGMVMGHELTHAFDDMGRTYDKNGNLHKWWKNETIREFNERTKCMKEQYSQYKLFDEKICGERTVGENIADNGGLKSAYHAYLSTVKKEGAEPKLPGLGMTNNQVFFLGFAQLWCSTSTRQAAHMAILKDSHTPAKYRVIGSLANSREFAKVFNCPAGSKMNPIKKCQVW